MSFGAIALSLSPPGQYIYLGWMEIDVPNVKKKHFQEIHETNYSKHNSVAGKFLCICAPTLRKAMSNKCGECRICDTFYLERSCKCTLPRCSVNIVKLGIRTRKKWRILESSWTHKDFGAPDLWLYFWSSCVYAVAFVAILSAKSDPKNAASRACRCMRHSNWTAL